MWVYQHYSKAPQYILSLDSTSAATLRPHSTNFHLIQFSTFPYTKIFATTWPLIAFIRIYFGKFYECKCYHYGAESYNIYLQTHYFCINWRLGTRNIYFACAKNKNTFPKIDQSFNEHKSPLFLLNCRYVQIGMHL